MKIAMALPLCLLILSVTPAASAVEMPVQKPGLWQMTMKSTATPAGRSFQMCQDAAFIAAGTASAAAQQKKDCKPTSSIRRVGDTWITDADCMYSGMHMVTHTVTTMHGEGLFHTEASSTMQTGKGAKKTNVMTLDSKWLGACKAGQAVGVPLRGR